MFDGYLRKGQQNIGSRSGNLPLRMIIFHTLMENPGTKASNLSPVKGISIPYGDPSMILKKKLYAGSATGKHCFNDALKSDASRFMINCCPDPPVKR